MATLVTAAHVKTRLFGIKGLPVDRRPAGLTDPVIDEYIQRLSAEVLSRIGLTSPPPSGELKRDAVDGICLDLVLIALRRDYFGLDGQTMQALNTQESNAWRRLDELKDTSVAGSGGPFFEAVGAQ